MGSGMPISLLRGIPGGPFKGTDRAATKKEPSSKLPASLLETPKLLPCKKSFKSLDYSSLNPTMYPIIA